MKLLSVEHEKRTHLLQEKRAESIGQLYALLNDFLGAAYSFTRTLEWTGEPSKEEKAKTLAEKQDEFQRYFHKHRIYFTKDLCDKD